MKHHAADELHIIMALAERALGGFAHRGEGGHQQVVQRLAFGELLAKFGGSGAQRIVGEGNHFRFERIDRGDARIVDS